MSSRVAFLPLPALAAAAPLDHVEAVTIVREVVKRVLSGELPGVPSAHVIRLSESGALNIEGPVAADGSDMRRAVQLLESLLPATDAPRRVPGALRLIIGRALGTLDLPPYASLASFADALSRFVAIDPSDCFRRIVANRPEACVAESAVEPAIPDLTITVSDIRRARRATGIPLAEISRRCDVPAPLLRQLEWGYLENWPRSLVGRRLIGGYARAAGLDEQLVMDAVWPLLRESASSRHDVEPRPVTPAEIVVEPERVVETTGILVRIEPIVPRVSNVRRVVAALTIPALLAIGVAPALWHTTARRASAREGPPAAARIVQPPPVADARPAVRETPPPPPETAVMIATPASADPAVRATPIIVRQPVMTRAPQPAAARRPAARVAPKPSQRRQKASHDRGPKKWGVWVLNKMGVRIVNTNTEQ
jgi:Helix-turn-helix domain